MNLGHDIYNLVLLLLNTFILKITTKLTSSFKLEKKLPR